MRKFKLIDELQQSMELDIFGKSAKVIAKHFVPVEVKAMLMTEHHPSILLMMNLERLLKEFIELEEYKYAQIIYDFINKKAAI